MENQLVTSFIAQQEIQLSQASSKIEKCLQRNCLLLCLQKVQTAHQRSNNALVDCLAEHLVRVYCNEPYASFAWYYGASQLQCAACLVWLKKSSLSITGGQQKQALWQVPNSPSDCFCHVAVDQNKPGEKKNLCFISVQRREPPALGLFNSTRL